jgi:CelD/BcsL family acetyltransferase involved in cellulose biosynthesis
MGEMPPVRTRIIESASELSNLTPAWWDLVDRVAHPQPTQTPLWLGVWWSVFGGSGGRQLRIVAVESASGQLLGLVPLLRRWTLRAGVVPASTLELLGSGEDEEDEICSEYIGAAVAAGHEEAVADAFAEALCSGRLGAWDELRMSSMSADDPMVPWLADALRRKGLRPEVRATNACPFVELPSTWDAYVGQLESHQRYFVRRTLRDLEAWAGPGGAVLRRAGTPEELKEGWRILRELHAARWQGAGVFGSPKFRRFHELVIPELLRGRGGTLDILWLEVHGAPVAAGYYIVHRGNIHFYQSGRRLDVPKNARPGIALQLLVIQRAIQLGYRSFDFLSENGQYKTQLTRGEVHHLVTLSAVAPTLRARAGNGAVGAARKLVHLARSVRTKGSGWLGEGLQEEV